MGLTGFVDEFLAKNPRFCETATGLWSQYRKKQNMDMALEIGGSIAGMSACGLFPGGFWIAVCGVLQGGFWTGKIIAEQHSLALLTFQASSHDLRESSLGSTTEAYHSNHALKTSIGLGAVTAGLMAGGVVRGLGQGLKKGSPSALKQSSLHSAKTRAEQSVNDSISNNLNSIPVVVIKDGIPPNWLEKIAPKLKKKYNLEIFTDPKLAEKNTTLGYSKFTRSRGLVIGLHPKVAGNPRLHQSTIHHELIHARVARTLLDTSRNPGLYIRVESSTNSIPMRGSYSGFFSMDEILANYKGGLAARALMKRTESYRGQAHQKVAERFREDALSQLSNSKQFSELSLKYLDLAERSLQQGQFQISNSFHLVDVYIMGGKIKMSFPFRKDLLPTSEVKANVREQIIEAKKQASSIFQKADKAESSLGYIPHP